MNKWTLHVEEFGKIEKADIQVSPFTLFIGDNNSGKSYIMALLYGFLTLDTFYSDFQIDTNTKSYQEYCQWIEKFMDACRDENAQCRKQLLMFQDLLNQVLAKNKDNFVLRLFNRSIRLKNIKINFDKNCQHQFIGKNFFDSYSNQKVFFVFSERDMKQRTVMESSGVGIKFQEEVNSNAYNRMLFHFLARMLKRDFLQERGPIYFPTARTGFLLTYKTLVGKVIQNQFNYEEEEKNLLTRPVSNFLARLSSLSITEENYRYKDILDLIESNMLRGKIQVSDLPSHDVMYKPEGEQCILPMFITSAVVTEMAPLVLFLRYDDIGTVLIEEPEISLHPQLQWQMTRALIQLVNTGMPIFVSTHSDIIMQHINNMIKAYDLADKEEFLEKENYVLKDFLDREMVSVYQFETNKDNRTEIKKLPCGEYGFEAMTFYHTLDEMNQQIERLEDRMEDA